MSVRIGVQELAERRGVDEVPVLTISYACALRQEILAHVCEDDTVWRVDVEGLSLRMSRTARSRVTHYPISHLRPHSNVKH